jgi:hypothetical protein
MGKDRIMATLKDIRDQISKVEPKASQLFQNEKELQYLTTIIQDDERIEGITRGSYRGKKGIVLATSARVIHSLSSSHTEFPYSKMTSMEFLSSIEFYNGESLGKFRMIIDGKKEEIHSVPPEGKKVAEKVRALFQSFKLAPSTAKGAKLGKRSWKGLSIFLTICFVLIVLDWFLFSKAFGK